jgi:soluble lytic murein transglycosylase-like protein
MNTQNLNFKYLLEEFNKHVINDPHIRKLRRNQYILFVTQLLPLIILGYFVWSTNNLRREYSNGIETLNEQVAYANRSLELPEDKNDFFSKGDSLIHLNRSDLATGERYMFLGHVWDNSKRFNLDPYIILTLAKYESGFRKRATNLSGARGMFQFMPSTFSLCARMLGETVANQEGIYDLERQTRYACFYLRLLMDDCGDIDLAIARYEQSKTTVPTEYSNKIVYSAKNIKRI